MPETIRASECGSEKRVLKAFQQLLHKRHFKKKTTKITKFHYPSYYHKNVFIVWCHQSSKRFWFKVLYEWCCHGNNEAITPTRTQNEGWVTLIAYKTTRKIYFHKFHLHLLYNIDNACEYIIFVTCLYWAKYNQQATIDQHFDVILGLTFFLTSHSKLDYICRF